MDNLLEEFFRALELDMYSVNGDDEDVPYERDTSEFNVIDGEESDYGIIRYLSPNKEIIAVLTVEGGDKEWMSFTAAGIEYMTPFAEKVFRDRVESLKQSLDNGAGG